MLYPRVTEVARAGHARIGFPRTQREVVELSLRANPPRVNRPFIKHDLPRGIFR